MQLSQLPLARHLMGSAAITAAPQPDTSWDLQLTKLPLSQTPHGICSYRSHPSAIHLMESAAIAADPLPDISSNQQITAARHIIRLTTHLLIYHQSCTSARKLMESVATAPALQPDISWDRQLLQPPLIQKPHRIGSQKLCGIGGYCGRPSVRHFRVWVATVAA